MGCGNSSVQTIDDPAADQGARHGAEKSAAPFRKGVEQVREEEDEIRRLCRLTHFDSSIIRKLRTLFIELSSTGAHGAGVAAPGVRRRSLFDQVMHRNDPQSPAAKQQAGAPVPIGRCRLRNEQFCLAMGLTPGSVLGQTVFNLFNVTQTSSISFREFLCTLSVLSVYGSFEDKVRFSFALYDTDRDGYISFAELHVLLKAVTLEQHLALTDAQVTEMCKQTMHTAKNLARMNRPHSHGLTTRARRKSNMSLDSTTIMGAGGDQSPRRRMSTSSSDADSVLGAGTGDDTDTGGGGSSDERRGTVGGHGHARGHGHSGHRGSHVAQRGDPQQHSPAGADLSPAPSPQQLARAVAAGGLGLSPPTEHKEVSGAAGDSKESPLLMPTDLSAAAAAVGSEATTQRTHRSPQHFNFNGQNGGGGHVKSHSMDLDAVIKEVEAELEGSEMRMKNLMEADPRISVSSSRLGDKKAKDGETKTAGGLGDGDQAASAPGGSPQQQRHREHKDKDEKHGKDKDDHEGAHDDDDEPRVPPAAVRRRPSAVSRGHHSRVHSRSHAASKSENRSSSKYKGDSSRKDKDSSRAAGGGNGDPEWEELCLLRLSLHEYRLLVESSGVAAFMASFTLDVQGLVAHAEVSQTRYLPADFQGKLKRKQAGAAGTQHAGGGGGGAGGARHSVPSLPNTVPEDGPPGLERSQSQRRLSASLIAAVPLSDPAAIFGGASPSAASGASGASATSAPAQGQSQGAPGSSLSAAMAAVRADERDSAAAARVSRKTGSVKAM